jgi:hypothetical protein
MSNTDWYLIPSLRSHTSTPPYVFTETFNKDGSSLHTIPVDKGRMNNKLFNLAKKMPQAYFLTEFTFMKQINFFCDRPMCLSVYTSTG